MMFSFDMLLFFSILNMQVDLIQSQLNTTQGIFLYVEQKYCPSVGWMDYRVLSFLLFTFIETGSHSVTQNSLELRTLLLHHLPQHWDYRHAMQHRQGPCYHNSPQAFLSTHSYLQKIFFFFFFLMSINLRIRMLNCLRLYVENIVHMYTSTKYA